MTPTSTNAIRQNVSHKATAPTADREVNDWGDTPPAKANALVAVLVARELHKTFASGDRQLAVLRGASLSVAAGESVSIRGESGAGKSTLLNLLAGLDTPDSGEVYWQGHSQLPQTRASRLQTVSFGGPPNDVCRTALAAKASALVAAEPSLAIEKRSNTSRPSARALATMRGIIFQSFYLIPEIDALANVRLAGAICGLSRGEAKTRARELLARVGLGEREHHLPAQLSGGERQRVAIARALVAAPPLVLADEPTGNLDERTGDAVIKLLLGLCRERQTALVLVTHNPAHAAKCARQLTVHEGVVSRVA